jgi:hypothetical protein
MSPKYNMQPCIFIHINFLFRKEFRPPKRKSHNKYAKLYRKAFPSFSFFKNCFGQMLMNLRREDVKCKWHQQEMEICIRETNNYKPKFDEFPKSCNSIKRYKLLVKHK